MSTEVWSAEFGHRGCPMVSVSLDRYPDASRIPLRLVVGTEDFGDRYTARFSATKEGPAFVQWLRVVADGLEQSLKQEGIA